jgi:hypothetical protein
VRIMNCKELGASPASTGPMSYDSRRIALVLDQEPSDLEIHTRCIGRIEAWLRGVAKPNEQAMKGKMTELLDA